MPLLEAAIQSLLTTGSPLASGSKVTTGRAREGWTAPYTVHFLVTPQPRHAHDGPLDLRRDTVQVSCFGGGVAGYEQARSEAEIVRGLLDGYAGTVAGVTIQSCLLTDGRIIYESDSGLWHASQDFDIEYK